LSKHRRVWGWFLGGGVIGLAETAFMKHTLSSCHLIAHLCHFDFLDLLCQFINSCMLSLPENNLLPSHFYSVKLTYYGI
jgi:hypothetical protein